MKKQLMSCLLLLIGVAGTSLAQVGLDPSFAQGGIKMAWGYADNVFVKSENIYIQGGYAKELPKKYMAFSLLKSGGFNINFGTNGYALRDGISLLASFYPDDMQVVTSGVLLIDELSDRTGRAIHLDSLGTLDYTYGQGGMAHLPAMDFPVFNTDPQNRLLHAGKCTDCLGEDTMSVVRYKANGMPDSSFGIHGRVNTSVAPQYKPDVYSVETAPDGKVVVGEESYNTLWAAYRYHADGRVDSSFGGTGHTNINWSGKGLSKALVRPNSKVVMCGYGDSVTVVQLNADGTLDMGFGRNGIGRMLPGLVEQSALRPTGELVMGGFIDSSFALWQMTAAGKPDTSFGQNGVVTLKVAGGEHRMNGLAIQADGKIVIGGTARRLAPYPNDTQYAVVARFVKNGRLDVASPIPPAGRSSMPDLYPNPAGDILNVIYIGLAGKQATVVIYDVIGRVIQQQTINTTANRSEIDVQSLVPGLYILELRSEDGFSSRKQFLKK